MADHFTPEGQLRAFARFAASTDLTEHLRRLDWEAVARAWNGPGYKINRYDERLRDEYDRRVAACEGC